MSELAIIKHFGEPSISQSSQSRMAILSPYIIYRSIMLVICLLSWRRNSKVRVEKCRKCLDFLMQHGTEIVPIEAKAEENLRSKSLASFVSSHPGMYGIRFSMSDYREQEWMNNIPLYAVSVYF